MSCAQPEAARRCGVVGDCRRALVTKNGFHFGVLVMCSRGHQSKSLAHALIASWHCLSQSECLGETLDIGDNIFWVI